MREGVRRRKARRLTPVLVPLAVLALMVLLAIFAPAIAPHDPEIPDPEARFGPPSAKHWLGADEYGRDIFSRIVLGARTTLVVAAASMALASIGGTAVGMVAGYARGGLEIALMRIVDGLLCFPPILLALFFIIFLGPSIVNLILVIGVLYIPRFARVAHAATLPARETEYVQAARALGATHFRILGRAILPNIAAPLFVQGSLALGHAILLESGLSFLGLGPPPPAPSWGRMIEQSNRFISLGVWPVVWPAIFVSTTVLTLNLLGDALRDLLDPRLRSR
jgi:peptide/nickel transport system permease protein